MNVSTEWQNWPRRLLRDERALRALSVAVAAVGIVQGGWVLWTEGPGAAAARLLVAAIPEDAVPRAPMALVAANVKYLGMGLVYSLFGGLIAWRAPARRGALMIGLAFAAIGANYTCAAEAFIVGGPEIGRRVTRLALWVGAAGAMLRAAQLFPKRLSAAHLRRLRPPGAGSLRRGTDALLRCLWAPASAWGLAVIMYPSIFFTPVPAPTWYLADTVLVLLALLYLRRQYQSETPRGRRKLTWIISAAAFSLGGMALSGTAHLLAGAVAFPVHLVVLLITTGTAAGSLVSMGMALFYSGAIDPSLVAERTVVASGAASALMGGIGVLEQVLAEYLEALLGGGTLAYNALLGGIVALAFRALWTGFRRLASRYLPDPDPLDPAGSNG